MAELAELTAVQHHESVGARSGNCSTLCRSCTQSNLFPSFLASSCHLAEKKFVTAFETATFRRIGASVSNTTTSTDAS
ncbi:unnamed protein product [Soboliphyme baturini]|uniref:Secreted protein n=1 Tax=Soboliphyme baturini TaxID=241478 RepID=A0A183I993_9BILA|nr:unnamed protein product [Soboliphyme baturini]